MGNYIYSEMMSGQEQIITDAGREVFDEFTASDYSDKGVEFFKNFIQSDEINESTDSAGMFAICCWDGKTPVGVIAVRDYNQICLLSVNKDYQQQGIERELLDRAIDKCRKIRPDLTEITVNSSPYAENIYKRLGFEPVGDKTTRDGITYIPMKMPFVSDVAIQEMQIEDYDEVYKLWSNTPGMGLSDADKKENIQKFLLRNKGLSYVCRHGDRIIGTVLCGHDGRRGHIYHVTVVEEYRGKGIGRRLVETSLEKLKSEGINKCHLVVFADNAVGNAFWASTGWDKRKDIFIYSKSI
ncbi:GNAT family N-acetyltransferase [Clostridium thermosuccinogenes]|nr:GNAT family N-acetyltransferase [Pseudoclostridium thermosuccinogenes]